MLPVSEIDLPLAPAAAASDDFAVVPELLLLPHAAASMASGTRAATAQAVRILLVTGEYSFTCARLRVRYTTRTRRVR